MIPDGMAFSSASPPSSNSPSPSSIFGDGSPSPSSAFAGDRGESGGNIDDDCGGDGDGDGSSPSSPASASSPKSVAVMVGDDAPSGQRGRAALDDRRPRWGRRRGGYYSLFGGGGGEDEDDVEEEEGVAPGETFGWGAEKGDAPEDDENEEEEDWIDGVVGRCTSRVVPITVRSSPLFAVTYRTCTANLTSDEPPTIRRRRCSSGRRGRDDDDDDVLIPLCAGPGAVRLFKFFVVTMVLIVAVHWVVRIPWLDWEHDADYTLRDFVLYDMNSVCLDLTLFFLVGRLSTRGGVDRLFPTLVPMAVGALRPSVMAKLPFLRYSISLYEIACHWPWQLFLYMAASVVAWTVVVTAHVRTMHSMNILLSRLVEVGVTVVLFLLPYVTDANFHLHHWYWSWMLGMHANLDRWWSLATLSFLWGTYVNGVAVWGRNPTLGCSYAFYLSTDGPGCNYMECYKAGEDEDGGFPPFVPPDWRNCSAEQNYIP